MPESETVTVPAKRRANVPLVELFMIRKAEEESEEEEIKKDIDKRVVKP